jgi:hypothetical protein
MAASTVKSENVTNIEASPITALDRKKGRIKTVIDQDAIATTSIDEANDEMLFGPVPSNAVILDVLVLNDDLDSHACPTLAADVGLVYSGIGGTQKKDGNTSGTAIDVNCFATAATTFQAANVTWTSLRAEADDIVDIKKEAWQVGGLSADPGGLFYVTVKVTTAAATAAAGDIVLRVDYI